MMTSEEDIQQIERKLFEPEEYIHLLKDRGFKDRYLYECRFENDKGYNPEMKNARLYVDKWDEMKRRGMGLLLWGDTGTGKTFTAGCIANALMENCVPVMMTNFPRILNALTGMFSTDRNSYIDSMNNYELLIIDDLGIERNSEFALEQVYSVIDCRYRSGKPFIVTTNLTLDELKKPGDLSHKRIYDRVLERCVPVRINNINIRSINAAQNMAAARMLLTGGDKA